MLHFWQMGKTITIRLGAELAAWLEDAAARTGVSQGKIVREQLERARTGGTQSPPVVAQGVLATMKGIADTGFRRNKER